MSSDSVLALKLLPGKFVVVERSDGPDQPMQWRLFKIHNVTLTAAELVEYDPDAATAAAAPRIEQVSWADIALAIAPYQLGVGQRAQALWPNKPDFSDLTTVYYSATVSGLKAPAKQKVKTKAVIFDTGETLAVPYLTLFDQQEVPAIMVPQPVTPQMVKLAVQRVQQAAAHLQQSSAQVAQRTASPAAGGSTTASPRTTADAIAVIQSLKRKAEAASPHTDSPANKRQATTTPLHSGSMPAAARPPPSAAPTGRTGLITPLPPAAHAAQHLKHQQAVAQQQQQQKAPKKEMVPREKRSWHVEWPVRDATQVSQLQTYKDLTSLMQLLTARPTAAATVDGDSLYTAADGHQLQWHEPSRLQSEQLSVEISPYVHPYMEAG